MQEPKCFALRSCLHLVPHGQHRLLENKGGRVAGGFRLSGRRRQQAAGTVARGDHGGRCDSRNGCSDHRDRGESQHTGGASDGGSLRRSRAGRRASRSGLLSGGRRGGSGGGADRGLRRLLVVLELGQTTRLWRGEVSA